MRDRRDEFPLELVERALLGHVAERVDDAVDEPHARDREPELLAAELERQRLRRGVARVGVRRDRDELRDGGPPGEHVFEPPAERVLGADTGDRRCRGVPVLDDAVVVDEEDAVVHVLEHPRVPLQREALLVDAALEPPQLDRALQ